MGTGIKVAIIDSGIDYNHSDLDDNYSGGWDFVNGDNNPDDPTHDGPMDDDGHGTHVAGTVAAEDNESGVVGVAPEAKLYALKALEGGSGYWSDIMAALQWCVDNGIQVTNNSYGSSGDPGYTVKDAFDNSATAGVLHVAAAGNSGNPPGRGDNVGYPARYLSVIAVAATDQSDKRARFSSTGPDVELAAPGVAINSTLLGGGYGEKNGTSMASPHVAGVAALVWAVNPGWSNETVRTQLRDTAEDLGDSSLYGNGLVNAAEAAPPTTDTIPPAKVTGLTVTTFSCAQLDLTWDANTEGDLDKYNVYRSTTSGGSYDLVALPTTNSYSDVGLTALTKYYYVVSAADVSGNEGVASDEAFGTTSADDLGPVTSDVVADPSPTNGATSVTLTADVSDETTGNSDIIQAVYFVGADGSVTSMSASDGTFDSPTEWVTASIDISGWADGQYTVYVHGKDVASNWGATESVVLDVTGVPSDIMHVFSIDMSLKIAGINVNAIATITIFAVDTDGNPLSPVEGATVSGTWTVATIDTDSGITDASGQVSLESNKVKNPKSGTTFTFTVDDVIKDGWTYDPLANTETSDSITIK